MGAIVWVKGETFKAESETADLRQPKWNENQTVLAAAIHTPNRAVDPLEGAVVGSWSLGIVEPSQGKGCCWLWRDGVKGMWGRRLWWEMHVEESWVAMEVKRYYWVMYSGWNHHHNLSPTTHQHWQLNSREAVPSNTWHIELQSRTPSRVPQVPIYRVGLLPGRAPLCSNNREGTQARETSKCLNGQSYRERLAKETFWWPATRGPKKD